MEFPSGSVIASFDITSLFTNVPIEETVNIVVDTIYENRQIRNLSKTNFKRLLKLCVDDNHFLFNGNHYSQHEGFAMGSPLSAPMANIFLCHHEKEWLDNCPLNFKPLLYKRYVDDTFLVFKNQSDIRRFLNYLNDRHQNIKFTLETENDNRLSFLDLNVEKKTHRQGIINFGFSIFRKLTFTGLGMNFHSHTSYRYKINNIRTLLYRAYALCDSWISMDREMKFLINYFRMNAYPNSIIYKTINNFLTSKCSDSYEPRKVSVNKLIMYQKIPYINYLCTNFIQTELNKLINNFYSHIDFRPVFVNPFTIGAMLNHKERLPECLRSGICYNFVCSACGATYVGSSQK